jgi:hypothetical protein
LWFEFLGALTSARQEAELEGRKAKFVFASPMPT